MKRRLPTIWVPMIWLAGGCLLLGDPPSGLVESGSAGSGCLDDKDCNDGLVCDWLDDTCVEACQDADCPGGFVCEDFDNECLEECYDNDDCRTGYRCCDYGDGGACDGREYECVAT